MLNANLILTAGMIGHRFEEKMLSALNDNLPSYLNHPIEVLACLNNYFKNKIDKSNDDFPIRYPSIVETVGNYFKNGLPK